MNFGYFWHSVIWRSELLLLKLFILLIRYLVFQTLLTMPKGLEFQVTAGGSSLEAEETKRPRLIPWHRVRTFGGPGPSWTSNYWSRKLALSRYMFCGRYKYFENPGDRRRCPELYRHRKNWRKWEYFIFQISLI